MIKETPFDHLPRRPRNPLIEAERQGFDDGYFGNPRAARCGRGDIHAVYSKAYDDGVAQRARADKDEKKSKVKA